MAQGDLSALADFYDRYATLIFGLARTFEASNLETRCMTAVIWISTHCHCECGPPVTASAAARSNLSGYQAPPRGGRQRHDGTSDCFATLAIVHEACQPHPHERNLWRHSKGGSRSRAAPLRSSFDRLRTSGFRRRGPPEFSER